MSEVAKPRSRSLSTYYARKAKFITMCEVCEYAVAVEVHHVDRDPFNNALSNLKALCKKCHQDEHYYRKKGPTDDEGEIAWRLAEYRKKEAERLGIPQKTVKVSPKKKKGEAEVDWQHRRTMNAAEYAATLQLLGLNISSAARYLGRSSRTSMRYMRDQATIPPAEVLLLRALLAKNIKPVVPAWRADKQGW